nr:PD-(D/E)XK nuclease domain-containing protein [uncultured Parabacteroides sp.]
MFTLLGAYADVEVHTSKGRIDLVIRTMSDLYIMKMKLDGTARDAIKQIDLKNYPDRFALCNLPITKVRVNFSTKDRNIESWVIE